ncbi:MAG: sugar transferase [Terriglobia bacterium]|jgi:exopolysaccharide biosynthesis polyprenyl glycosylphosphotransferase
MISEIFAPKRSRKMTLGAVSPLNPLDREEGQSEDTGFSLVSEELFRKVLSIERKRSERSRQRFVLMLVHVGKVIETDRSGMVLEGISEALSSSARETDLHGWYQNGSVVGVICTEIGKGDLTSILSALHSRVGAALRNRLGLEQMNAIHISFHVFPDDLDLNKGGRSTDISLYPDLLPKNIASTTSRVVKRAIDLTGSLAALILLSPLYAVIAVAIKLTSKGPILFKQDRVGEYGIRFSCLKFRSMYYKNDAKIHQEYVRGLISGKHDGKGNVYKIKDDPRVTPVGKFLRKTSLDELPQFFNVLKGEMSLVGPRPPIPYEVEAYEVWHRRRFLEAKPGITGLWQVEGRSRTKFDEMVRLDLRYAKTWSPWLDIKILLRTPAAVFRGDGAY